MGRRLNPALDSIGAAWSGAIAGVNASRNMMRSSINQAAVAAGAVVWSGGAANIVWSLIDESGGLSVRDDIQPGVMNTVTSPCAASRTPANETGAGHWSGVSRQSRGSSSGAGASSGGWAVAGGGARIMG